MKSQTIHHSFHGGFTSSDDITKHPSKRREGAAKRKRGEGVTETEG
jgi:hypothetical protein